MHHILEETDKNRPYYLVGISDEQFWLDRFKKGGIAPLGWERTPETRLKCDYVITDLNADEGFLREVYCRFHRIPKDIFKTKRTYVRELGLDDLPALRELYEAKGITDYIEPLYAPGAELEYEKDYIRYIYGFYGYGMWLVFDRENDRLIGRCGIECRKAADDSENVELGYIIHPDYQGKGYATEVCRSILEFAFEHGIYRLNARIAKENLPSVALAKKLGFTPTGIMDSNGEEIWRLILPENPNISVKNS